MNRLRNTRAYLCGPMDRVADGGVAWRDRVKKSLAKYGVLFLDPCNKPTTVAVEDAETRAHINQSKSTGDWDSVSEHMKWIRRVDLRMVHLADFLIVWLDMDVHACGTYEEITWANQQKKPILIVVAQGKEHAPSWLFGMLPHQFIFSTFDELFQYLDFISSGVINDMLQWSDNRWHIFDWMGEV